MKKVIPLAIVLILLLSLTSCIVRNEPAPETAAPDTEKESPADSAVADLLLQTMEKAKSLDNIYYELVADYNDTRHNVTKVWVKDGKAKIEKDGSVATNYIDFNSNTFIDVDNKTKEKSTIDPNQNHIDNFKRYAGAFLSNADYEMAVSSLKIGEKETVEGKSCIVGSYVDSTTDAKLYISEEDGIVMKFQFSDGSNKSLSYVTNIKIGSVTDQDVELP